MRSATGNHLIIGLAPGPGRDLSRRALDCASGSRLARMAGVTLDDLLRRCDTVNAYETGDESRTVARRRVQYFVGHLGTDWETIMLVGRETCRFAGVVPPVARGSIFGIHHTSGLSRWWNDPVNGAAAKVVVDAWWRAVGIARPRLTG